MKKKGFALLCALVLLPALCMSETTETGYTCDNCDYEGSFSVVVTGTEVRDGAPGEWYEIRCPNCGSSVASSWRQTGPAVVSQPETNTGSGNSGKTESPADPPKESSGSGTENQPAQTDPPKPTAPPTLPPVAPDTSSSSSSGSSSSGQVQKEPEVTAPPKTPSAGGKPARVQDEPVCRNTLKYPHFSAAYPSRRLNLRADPEAWAPIPGPKIYPADPAEGSSILQRMLGQ